MQTRSGLITSKEYTLGSSQGEVWNQTGTRTGSDIEGEPLGRLEYSNVRFLKKSLDAAKFHKPSDAVVAPL